jgi:hypothetical protein
VPNIFNPSRERFDKAAFMVQITDKNGEQKILVWNFENAEITLEEDVDNYRSIFDPFEFYANRGTYATIRGRLGNPINYSGRMPGEDHQITDTKALTDGEEEIIIAELIEDD